MEVAQQVLPTNSWLQQWLSSLQTTITCTVPLSARNVHTPLCAPAWGTMLRSHPDKQLVQFVLEGISRGFHIGFVELAPLLHSARSNMNSALEHLEVPSYREVTWSCRRPLPSRCSSSGSCKPLWSHPKGKTGKWRFIPPKGA